MKALKTKVLFIIIIIIIYIFNVIHCSVSSTALEFSFCDLV